MSKISKKKVADSHENSICPSSRPRSWTVCSGRLGRFSAFPLFHFPSQFLGASWQAISINTSTRLGSFNNSIGNNGTWKIASCNYGSHKNSTNGRRLALYWMSGERESSIRFPWLRFQFKDCYCSCHSGRDTCQTFCHEDLEFYVVIWRDSLLQWVRISESNSMA